MSAIEIERDEGCGGEEGDAAAGQSRRGELRRWLGLAVALTGTFMSVLDVFIVNVAIPSIRRDLGASFAAIELVVAGYGLAYAVTLITGGRLGDLYGRRRVFMAGMAGFTASSLLCGVAPSPTALILARLAQGFACAVMFPQVFAIIRVGFPEDRQRAAAFAIMGVVLGLASVAGQLLGGLIIAADLFGLGWRPVFLINLPPGIAALMAAPFLIDESRAPGARRLDPMGMALSAGGLFLLLFPLIEGRERGWPWWSLALLAGSVPVLGLFARDQQRKTRRQASPLLDMRLFGNAGFVTGVVLVLATYSTFNSFYLVLTILLQSGLGKTPWQAALLFTPLAFLFTVSSLLAARVPPAARLKMLILGAVITGLGYAIGAVVAGSEGGALTGLHLLPSMALQGLGCGFVLTPLLNVILGNIPERDAGAAAGMIGTMQQVGGALGVALVGVIFFGDLGTGSGPAAYAHAFARATLYNVAATAVAVLLLRRLGRVRRTVP